MAYEVARGARGFFSGTIFSRLSGCFRDIFLAFFFGSSAMIASFMIAYRFSNLFRRLLGEGPLQGGFIPHFSEKSGKEAAIFFRDVFFSLLTILVLVVAITELILTFFFSRVSTGSQEIVILCMIMLPGLIFISLYAFSSAHLQCEKSFFLPAASGVVFNLIWILAAYITAKNSPHSARGLAIGVVAAFFFQWLVVFYPSFQKMKGALSFREWGYYRPFSSEVIAMIKPLSLGVIGVAAMQINAALDSLFARVADPSGPAYLWYAIRLQQLPLAMLGISLSGALLPALSKIKEEEPFRKQLRFALQAGICLMVAATGALIVLGKGGIRFVFGHGNFDTHSVAETFRALWGYGLGLAPSVIVLILASAFYAKKNYFVPTISSLISVGVNIFLNTLFVFVFHWGVFSIALATSLSATFNAIFLFLFQRSLLKGLVWGLAKALIATLIPAITVSFMNGLPVIALMGIYGTLFFLGVHILKIEEVAQLVWAKNSQTSGILIGKGRDI